MHPRGSRNVFGHIAPNGLNFSQCIHNPNSRIARIVRYITEANKNGHNPTRSELVSNALGKQNASRGWGPYVFGYGIKNNFLTKERIGNTVVYGLGTLAPAVKTK
jgi:hypothetical protein